MYHLVTQFYLIAQNLAYHIVVLSLAIPSEHQYFDHRKPDIETFLEPLDFQKAKQIDEVLVSDYNDDEELLPPYTSGKFEGDMDVDVANLLHVRWNEVSDVHQVASSNRDNIIQYNAVRNIQQLWPSHRIPYAISSQYSPSSRSIIAAAMAEYARSTCVQWVPKTIDDYDYIYIVPDQGCYSMVGLTGGKQIVSLGLGCIQKGIIMHELMHAVGFFHEQSRTDRDEHITVLWQNIQPGMQGQFEKYGHGMIDMLGAQYDYDSIMHYGPRAFSVNGQPTLVPKRPAVIGQRIRFSKLDIYKINKLYNCLDTIKTEENWSNSSTERLEQNKTSNATVTTELCKNVRTDCDEFSLNGWCDGNPKWMRHYCPESCGFCNVTEQICTNKRNDCSFLAQNGHCNISERYMRKFCAEACNFCLDIPAVKNSSAAIFTTTTTKTYTTVSSKKEKQWKRLPNSIINTTESSLTEKNSCFDQKLTCDQWKAAGFCDGLFRGFMLENCRKTCKFCS